MTRKTKKDEQQIKANIGTTTESNVSRQKPVQKDLFQVDSNDLKRQWRSTNEI